MSDDSEYGFIPSKQSKEIDPPEIDYLPPLPKSYRPGIALIGAGGVSEFHLRAYQTCDFNVLAIVDRSLDKAQQRRDQFFPNAEALTDYREVLKRNDIEIVDATPHPTDRLPIIEDSLRAGKHVLSQKPFVLDLEDGRRLASLAKDRNVKLAVNQNGRWAPHFSYLRKAIKAGLIGQVTSIDFSLQWDQTWIAGNEGFEKIRHLILFDFAIHWFDMANCLMDNQKADTVYALATGFPGQLFQPPAIASAIIGYPNAQVRLSFHGHALGGEEDVTTVVGTKGLLRSRGSGINEQSEIHLFTESGHCRAPLKGGWFETGFQGAMGELLRAIDEHREPLHSAKNNLKSLELCFAALASADNGKVVKVGSAQTAAI